MYKIFLSICLSDLVPLEHPFCSPVFAGINMNFMQTAILRNGSLLHVKSKFCRFCRKYLCWGFTAQSTQWGHVERGHFT